MKNNFFPNTLKTSKAKDGKGRQRMVKGETKQCERNQYLINLINTLPLTVSGLVSSNMQFGPMLLPWSQPSCNSLARSRVALDPA